MALVQRFLLLALIGAAPVLSALAACSSGAKTTPPSSSGAGGATTGTGGKTGSSTSATGGNGAGGTLLTGSTGTGQVGPFNDFPATPIVDPSAPANAPALFSAPDGGSGGSSAGGPCLFEPEPDTLFPNNWVRPRFNWNAGAGENLFEIRLHTSAEVNDLLVYTATAPWTMAKDMWTALAADAVDVPITVTIRGAQLDGNALAGPPTVGSVETMTIAPASAAGSIVYWTTSNGSQLFGFSAGDETVVQVLVPSQVQMQSAGGTVTCVGCHTSTPDGNFAGFTAQQPWSNALASIQSANVGAPPSFLGMGALQTLTSMSPFGIQTYSKAHWSNGDHVMITPYGDSVQEGGIGGHLTWIDLEAQTSGMGTSYGFLARTGDTNDVGAPTWSHDGSTIVYVSTNCELTGRLDMGFGHLYSVPYNNRQGGTATHIVTGAADSNNNEYYPAFSPDDAYLAFNEIPVGQKMYSAPAAEVFVIPAAGGTATRLAANDPAACTGATSPGVTNSWPKWAPQVTTIGTTSYYWLIFSSTRDVMQSPQLYITGVVIDSGVVTTHGALYIWNQPADTHNHTPAWDYFMIPPPPAM
jgi:hypothetical protein